MTAQPRDQTGVVTPRPLTATELLDVLARRGVELSLSKLRYWQKEGLIPRPARRAPPGDPARRAHALYPPWVALLVEQLALDAALNTPIAQLKRRAPEYRRVAAEAYGHAGGDVILRAKSPPFPTVVVSDDRATVGEEATARRMGGAQLAASGGGGAGGITTLTVIPRVTRALQRAAWDYAARYAEQAGADVAGATLTLTLGDGTTAHVPILPPPADESPAD